MPTTTSHTPKKPRPEDDAGNKANERPEDGPPAVVTTVNLDGLRAVDTSTDDDGNTRSVPRDATFAEQVAQLAPLVLAQAVGLMPGAADGTVTTDGGVITIALRPL